MIDAVNTIPESVAMTASLSSSCIFFQIARSSTSTALLHQNDKIVVFQDINPLAFRFGFHQRPFNSVNHLHLHCFALPFSPRWKAKKYLPLGPFGGFIETEKLLERIKPLSSR